MCLCSGFVQAAAAAAAAQGQSCAECNTIARPRHFQVTLACHHHAASDHRFLIAACVALQLLLLLSIASLTFTFILDPPLLASTTFISTLDSDPLLLPQVGPFLDITKRAEHDTTILDPLRRRLHSPPLITTQHCLQERSRLSRLLPSVPIIGILPSQVRSTLLVVSSTVSSHTFHSTKLYRKASGTTLATFGNQASPRQQPSSVSRSLLLFWAQSQRLGPSKVE